MFVFFIMDMLAMWLATIVSTGSEAISAYLAIAWEFIRFLLQKWQ